MSATGRRGPRVGDDDQPGLHLTFRNAVTLAGFLLAALAALYFLLPKVAGLEDTWHRIKGGAPRWMFFAARCSPPGCSAATSRCSAAIFVRAGDVVIAWRASYQITMAGLAASRIFAAGGAGGARL